MANNLVPGQYQIGSTIFGAHTQYPVLEVKPQSYNVNNQDFQVSQANEIQMGQDTLQAGVITFTIGVRDNAPMPHITGGTLPAGLVDKSSLLMSRLQGEWKADDVRQQWGQLKPITYRNWYGQTRRIYGRPRKFESKPKTRTSQFYRATAEYARIDTLTHNDTESLVSLVVDDNPVVHTRAGGDAAAWYRVLLTGPMSQPQITVGDNHIWLDMDILAGVVVEVSSYPWQRRIIDSNGVNHRNKLIGNTKYLDKLQLPAATPIGMAWTAQLTDPENSTCLVLWRDAYSVL
ncbi:hypothetical protein [Mycobacterium canetti]|uniref:hypothetical protein n=1 Tax=Mycobacterium canetti TaxID=78331 RepID=UPI00034A9F51|nr:hypothetical protein [Mycobacterium canetti]